MRRNLADGYLLLLLNERADSLKPPVLGDGILHNRSFLSAFEWNRERKRSIDA